MFLWKLRFTLATSLRVGSGNFPGWQAGSAHARIAEKSLGSSSEAKRLLTYFTFFLTVGGGLGGQIFNFPWNALRLPGKAAL